MEDIEGLLHAIIWLLDAREVDHVLEPMYTESCWNTNRKKIRKHKRTLDITANYNCKSVTPFFKVKFYICCQYIWLKEFYVDRVCM
jgi:hypothetical protein